MKKQNIRIAVAGTSGRIGQQLIQVIDETEGVLLTAALEKPGSKFVGKDVGTLIGQEEKKVYIADDLLFVKDDFDVLIDFTQPEATSKYVSQCCDLNKKMIIGTTGLDVEARKQILEAGEQIGIVFAANYSIGVNVVLKLLEKTAEIVGTSSDIEIIEAHHRNKVDAPSGTALAMGEVIANTLNEDLKQCGVFSRHGYTGVRKPGSIGFSTIRAGDIVGEHTVMFVNDAERIEITHKASNRKMFALGAVKAACWLMTQPIGLYSMRDVLSLND